MLHEPSSDIKNFYIEVGSGVGGQEAMLFSHEIFLMYWKFCQRNGWNAEISEVADMSIGKQIYLIKLLSFERYVRCIYTIYIYMHYTTACTKKKKLFQTIELYILFNIFKFYIM